VKKSVLMRLCASVAFAASMSVAGATAANAEAAEKTASGKVDMDVLAALSFMQDPEMSPDGTKIAVALGAANSRTYGIIDLTKPGSKPVLFAQSETFKEGGDREIVAWEWFGNDYLLITLMSRDIIFGERVDLFRLVSYDLKTKKMTPIAWQDASGSAARILHSDDKKGEILLQRQSLKYGNERAFRPEVVRVNVATGKIVETVVLPNPIVTSWAADSKGVVRMGSGSDRDSGEDRTLYRSNASETMKTVQKVVDKDFAGAGLSPEVFLEEPDMALVTSNHEGRTAIYKANLKTMQIVEKVFGHDKYDISGVIANEDDNAALGYEYVSDRPRIEWVSSMHKQIQEILDEQFGAGNAMVVSSNKGDSKLVVSVAKPSQPGGLYVYDVNAAKLSLLGWQNTVLKDAQLSHRKIITYTASDGLKIDAVLTMPRHRKHGKNLPLVVLTHGGPYGVRDDTAYDDWSQAIAEQGYVVLQPNYRGSGGYGKEFVKAGRSDGFGTRMQDDLNDAMGHLVKEGIVDPKRACMMGWSYGGYASARAAQRDPDRWRCTIAGAGVYDLPKMRDYDKEYLGSFGSNYLAKGANELSAVSPARNAKGKWSPILIVHGVRDPRVPIEQGRILASALKSAGKVKGTDYDYIEQPRNGHYSRFFTKEERIEWLQGAANWLARFNPAYIPSDPDKEPPVTVTIASK
jgi:dipeptidyl aminopeptidase/acylaminoacyl peptidase